MNPTSLLDSLVNLRTELETSEGVADEVLEQVRVLDSEMHSMLESNELKAEETLINSLIDLETHFASEHPRLEKVMRELVDSLSQMGI